ncbi:Ig-like domain-containing protein [Cellulomonas sp. ATA003]|nr:Ig-like domain-containing protein [Cellulomonas sp. ATA003]WNB87592.1 Ig-like domain-containing protein [Cellulomonas sp. ATA003]
MTGDRVAGVEVSLLATVEPAGAAGSVTFTDGTRELGAVDVVDGTARLATPLGAGARALTASFTPASPQWEASTSGTVPVDVEQATSTVGLTLTDRAIDFGDVTTAVVTVDAPLPASGVVEIRSGDRVVASGELGTGGVAGTARIALPRDTGVGAHRLVAVYRGDADVAGSSSETVRLRVTAAQPVVTLGADSWTAERGDRPTVTVTVAGADGGPVPTGTVSVLVNLRRVATADLGPDGTVEVQLPRTTRTGLVTAVYGGNAGYRPVVELRTLRVR